MKKKLFCILLSLMMVLTMIPFATMTAFADAVEPITFISVNVSQLSVEEIKSIKNNTASNMMVTDVTPAKYKDFLNQHTVLEGCKLFDSNNNVLFQFYEGGWYDEEWNKVDEPSLDDVVKVQINNGIKIDSAIETQYSAFFDSIQTVKFNNDVITKDATKEIYYSAYHSMFSVLYTYDLEKSDRNGSKLVKGLAIAAGITAATVGTIHTVKAIKNYKAEKAVKDEPTVKEEQKAIEPTIDEVKETVADVTIRCNTKKTADGTKVYTTVTDGDLEALEAAGYTVTYKFYRSKYAKKNYKLMETTANSTYTDTTGTEDTMYYYKAKVVVADKDGNEVAVSAIKDCKYGNRKF